MRDGRGDALNDRPNLDPQDWTQLRAQGHRMLDDLLDHLQTLRDRPVWRSPPEAVRARHRTPLPADPTPLAAVHQDFLTDILPYASGNTHPGFMGWVQGAGTPVGVLADMLAAGLNPNCGGRDHMAIQIEREVAGWVRQMLGFPETATGILVTGASLANFIGVLVARQNALGPQVRRVGVAGAGGRLTAYASTAAHACVPRAMEMAGLGREALRLIPLDADHRIDLDRLRAQIDLDRREGRSPFMVVGSAGTVDCGAVDDLAGLADIAATEKLWFHVDGAYGALGLLSPEVAPKLAGLERADSVAFDFHKWGQVPYDAGFVMVRDGSLHHDTFATPTSYLARERRGIAGGDFWPCDYGPDLSRGFRALKVWFTLKVLGADAIGGSITRSCELARTLARMVEETPQLERLAPVDLNIVCFGYRCEDPERVNPAIVVGLQEAGAVAPSLTRIDGRAAIRAALFNHRTEERDLRTLIDQTLALGQAAARPGAA